MERVLFFDAIQESQEEELGADTGFEDVVADGDGDNDQTPFETSPRKKLKKKDVISTKKPKKERRSPPKCSAENCTRLARGVVQDEDQTGAPGRPLCALHGGDTRPCNVPGCTRMCEKNVRKRDRYGVAGPRCRIHGKQTKKCAIEGCTIAYQGTVTTRDIFGPPGPRCWRHGGQIQCEVRGCPTVYKSLITEEDQYGPAGQRRCHRHGG